jgi:hypothetical protein
MPGAPRFLCGRNAHASSETRRVADRPDAIVLRRHRDLEGRTKDVWIRRSLFALIAALPVIALFNVFGQRPGTSRATSPAASLKVYAPVRVRGGLIYEARFRITAKQELKKARLVLGPGWLEGTTVNTIEPSPLNEASQNGKLSLELGHISAGKSFLLFMQFQVNPTNVGHRSRGVELYDGDVRLLVVHQKVTVFP